MFGIFKRKDKGLNSASDLEEWGQPSQRKLSKDEAAREAAEQKLVEEKNRERREMYRLAGRERIFADSQGRRLALRVEDNTGANATTGHPPILVIAFWGTREVGHFSAEVSEDGASLRQLNAHIEKGYENRGIAAEILRELETIAQEKGLRQICCAGLENDEWSAELLTQAGYSLTGSELVKNL